MIKIFNNNTQKYHTFEITKFPDKTSQVWKVDPEPKKSDRFTVIWMFEDESEFAHVLQVGALLSDLAACPVLNAPYLPYGRQDKGVSNTSSFAGTVLMHFLNQVYEEIVTYDAHSGAHGVTSVEPEAFFKSVVPNYDLVCFPDAGAVQRYLHITTGLAPAIWGDKVRDQLTGEITGLSVHGSIEKILGARIVICDDIADGGMTFIKMADRLYELGAKEVSLCVSHGIFSRGREVLYNAGIKEIYTTNSRLNNPFEYPVVPEEIHNG